MRKRIVIFLLGVFTVGVAGDKTEPKKFEVVFTVKYNAISLEEAALKEKIFRELYKDACKVDVTLGSVGDNFTIGAGTWITTDATDLTWSTDATVEPGTITTTLEYIEPDSLN